MRIASDHQEPTMADTFVTAHEARMPLPHAAALAAVPARLMALARSERMRTPAPMFSFWLQLRGTAQVTAAEGSFTLHAGEWIALERGSAPEVQAGHGGFTLGLMLTPDVMHGALDPTDRGLLPGR